MKLDDPSLLSAYLDDELGPAERLAVEAALLTDAQLAESLQQLAAVRAQIVRLPRPVVDRDLAIPVLERLERLPITRWRRLARVHTTYRSLLRTGAILASAASILIVATLLSHLSEPRILPRTDRLSTGHVSIAANPGGSLPDAAVEAPTTKNPPTPVAVAVDPATTAPDAVVASTETQPGSSTPAAEDSAIRRYLERGDLRRLMVVVDEISPRTLSDVEKAIDATDRLNPILGQIRVAQGIEFDPRRPSEAVVYIVVLDDTEFLHLRRSLSPLSRETPAEVESLAPDVATQLADIGVLDLTRHPAASPLRPIPESAGTLKLARKSSDEGVAPVMPEPEPDDGSLALEGGPETDPLKPRETPPRGAASLSEATRVPGRRPSSPDRHGDGEIPSSGSSHVYLVWVTTRDGSHVPENL